jgi:hypothetical protein
MLPSEEIVSILFSRRISYVDTILFVANLNFCSRNPGFRDRDPLCVAAIGNKQKLALNGKVGINHPGPAVVQVHVRDLHGLILLCRYFFAAQARAVKSDNTHRTDVSATRVQ